MRAAPKIWSAAPVEAVTITGLSANGTRVLVASEVLERIRVLTIDRYSTRREGTGPLYGLLHAPRIAGLRRLTLTYGIEEKALVAVAESPHLTGLEWLTLGAGSFVAAPRGVQHTFTGAGGPARLLNVHAPSAGFHDRLRERA